MLKVRRPSEQHCFDQHCGLCTFELGDEEPIIASNLAGTILARLNGLRREYCDWSCNHPRNVAAAFHESCLAYAGLFLLPMDKLGRMVRHSLIPENGTSLAKTAPMEEFAAHYVMKHTPFPYEICQRIASYLVRPCSIAATLSVRGGKPRMMTVSLQLDIWVQYVKVHGTPYVASVANAPVTAAGCYDAAVLVYRPRQRHCVLHVMQDPWGVRRLFFTSEMAKMDVDPRKNIWWEGLRLTPGGVTCELAMFSDGFKLRKVVAAPWPSDIRVAAVLPGLAYNNMAHSNAFSLRTAIQLTTIWFNKTRTVGYNAELNEGVLVRLSSIQRGGGATTQCFAPRGTVDTQLYMPLYPGEWVGSTTSGRRLVLNTKRVLFAGSHVEEVNGVPAPTMYQFVCIGKGKNEVMGAHLQVLEDLRAMVCPAYRDPAASTSLVGLRPRLPRHASSHPRGRQGEAFYLSVTKLHRATSMRLSIDGQRITGLLLNYQDGTEDAVGRVCLSKLQRPERLYDDGIWILTEQVEEGAQVVRVAVEKPERNANRFLHVRWQGKLEWWSSVRHCELHYFEESDASSTSLDVPRS